MIALLIILSFLLGSPNSPETITQEPILVAEFKLYADPVSEGFYLNSTVDPRLFRSDCEAFQFMIKHEDYICSIQELLELNLANKNTTPRY